MRKAGKGARRLAELDEDDALFGNTRKTKALRVAEAAEAETAKPPVAQVSEQELPEEEPSQASTEPIEAPGLVLRRRPVKRKDSYYLPEALCDRLRNATSWLQGQGYSVSKGDIVAAALEQYIALLEGEHNASKPFPRSRRKLQQGHF